MRIRALLAAVGFVGVTAATAAAAQTEPYAAPGAVPPLSRATLEARFAAVRGEMAAALRTAQRLQDPDRAKSLSAMLAPARTFLSFDARSSGEAVEVLGDLAHADRIAVLVPGADGNLENFDSWKFAGGAARALADDMYRIDPKARFAVVAWLGYDTPSMLSPAVLTDGRATPAAAGLRSFVDDLKRISPTASIDLLCHSYGTVVCGKAAHGLPLAELALYGSPGTTFSSAKALHTRATVWAGRKSGDWVALVPHVRLFGRVGMGTDPTSKAFGARVFRAGGGTHSQYFKPGSASLDALALIALGRDGEVPRD